ncbi:alpha/beta family hydrolase [Pseudolabrys sp. Root1462]|uniref:dienelactone hydrolase family protein n=1 Tax=Pseudolabrys sp. Root1462 TaxID=1736466 RepID=UPI00191122C1|nr:alpha/beta family hydrolase [Pseudolabrys sp. Root1462]
MSAQPDKSTTEREMTIGPLQLRGDLRVPRDAWALVIFAHGSGSSRFSVRNRMVAEALNGRGIATLLFDLLTRDEEDDRANIFDIALLTGRLIDVVRWAGDQGELAALPVGLFGASTGAAAALMAAAQLGSRIGAVVSRGGRPDLAGASLSLVAAPTLLIVGGNDDVVITLNEQAYVQLKARKSLKIVPGASHLFPESGAMETVIALSARWFADWLAPHSHDKRTRA